MHPENIFVTFKKISQMQNAPIVEEIKETFELCLGDISQFYWIIVRACAFREHLGLAVQVISMDSKKTTFDLITT